MSMTDPISDMLTRIRNGQTARKVAVSMPASKSKEAVAKVLQDEGYITGYAVEGDGAALELTVALKYFEAGRGVIEKILERVEPAWPALFIAARMICPESYGRSGHRDRVNFTRAS